MARVRHRRLLLGTLFALAAQPAEAPKTILELQPFRTTASIASDARGIISRATLINLNPHINAWFVLEITRPDGSRDAYHLENPRPASQHLTLDASVEGIRVSTGGVGVNCPLWADGTLEEARRSGLPLAPLCADRIYMRNAVAGTYTNLERVTNFLRDHVWGGDRIVGFVREELFQDAFIERGALLPAPSAAAAPPASEGPAPAAVAAVARGAAVKPEHLGIGLEVPQMQLGQWYPAHTSAGVFVSVIQPNVIEPSILAGFRASVNALDPVEGPALDYLVAFDLSRFELGFELGTDHPRIGWSERVLPRMRDDRLPGPDGIDNAAPLVRTGILSPNLIGRVQATFAGGFKREHGAFRYGALAERNAGSHYGFIEQGTVFSKLEPGLATLIVNEDGSLDMKTWAEADDARLARVRHARQNGVALIETDALGGGRPGDLVNQWGPGNWSGSSEEHLRTLRSGACLANRGGVRYLIYGYFSAATPSAMARVFQAYHCSYAMHLDMNALEHTYLALYSRVDEKILVEHLIEGMAAVDRKGGEQLAPRFLSFPDDRDFFYVLRKEPNP